MNGEANDSSGFRYAVVFEDKLFNAACDIEINVDMPTKTATAFLEMKQFFGSNPAFRISLSDLQLLSKSIKSMREQLKLLKSPIDGARDRQLNVSQGNATFILVQPKDKAVRFTLSIGLFHREGELSQLDPSEIEKAITTIEARKEQVLKSVV